MPTFSPVSLAADLGLTFGRLSAITNSGLSFINFFSSCRSLILLEIAVMFFVLSLRCKTALLAISFKSSISICSCRLSLLAALASLKSLGVSSGPSCADFLALTIGLVASFILPPKKLKAFLRVVFLGFLGSSTIFSPLCL